MSYELVVVYGRSAVCGCMSVKSVLGAGECGCGLRKWSSLLERVYCSTVCAKF